MSVPPFVPEIPVICTYAAALVGLNPARNWLVLLIPLPNGSAPGPLNAGFISSIELKYWSCHMTNGFGGADAPELVGTKAISRMLLFVAGPTRVVRVNPDGSPLNPVLSATA